MYFQAVSLRVLQAAAKRNRRTFQGKAAFSSLVSDVTLESLDMKSAPLTTLSDEEQMMRDTGNNEIAEGFNFQTFWLCHPCLPSQNKKQFLKKLIFFCFKLQNLLLSRSRH